MKNLITALFVTLILFSPGSSGEWDLSGSVNANFSRTDASSNWEGKEADSSSWIIQTDINAGLDPELYSFNNSLKLEYGESSVSGDSPTTSADRIFLESVLLYRLSRYGNPYLGLSAESSFSGFFDPGILTESAGLGWELLRKENHTLDTRLGGALRQTLSGGVSRETQGGMEWVTAYKGRLNKNLRFESSLNIFTAFDAGADFRLDNSLHIRLREYLTARLSYLAVHDYDSSGRRPSFPEDIQTRFTAGIGLALNLF